MVLSWYEQKAVCILLTLLHLGIQIEITNAAHRETISNILSVLQCLC